MGQSMMELHCYLCGSTFQKRVTEVRRQLGKGRDYFFCSRTCVAVFRNRRYENKEITKTCPHCLEEFESRTGAKAATFCSRSCASAGSVTPARRQAMQEVQRVYGHTGRSLRVVAKGLRAREAWRYEEISAFLDAVSVEHVFEYPIEDVGIFDLAMIEEGVLVEFDGPDHSRFVQTERDGQKTEAAQGLGWRVLRLATDPGRPVSVSAFVRDVWKKLEKVGAEEAVV